jgi:hypothetical protein
MLKSKQKQGNIKKDSLHRSWGLAKRSEHRRIKGKQNKNKNKNK